MKSLKKLLITSALFSFGTFALGLPGMAGGSSSNGNNQSLPGLGGGSTKSDSDARYALMSLEADLMVFDQAAYLLKLNQLILERLPVTLEDKWPEYLNSIPEGDYEKCLLNLLKEDFHFYPHMDEYKQMALNRLFKGGSSNLKSIIDLLQSGAIDAVGKSLENAKLVVFYKYPGCECGVWSSVRNEKDIDTAKACEIKKPHCEIFRTNVEDFVVNKALKEGIDNFLELKVDDSCLRPVYGYFVRTTTQKWEGEISAHPSSFEEAFLMVLPTKYVQRWKEDMEKFQNLKMQYEKLNAEIKQLENKILQNPSDTAAKNQLAAKKKDLKDLETQLKAVEAEIDKTLKEAKESVELSEEKIKLAKKLYNIAKFVDDTLDKEMGLVTLMLPKLFLDGYVLIQTVSSGNLNGLQPNDIQRIQYLAKNIVAFFPNIIGIYSGIATQKAIVGKYKSYLEAVSTLESKTK